MTNKHLLQFCWGLFLLAISGIAVANIWEQILNGEHRRNGPVRDAYRHPVETLTFFGINRSMTVVEIWPGGGWYTEVIAPYLREKGKFYAAHFDPMGERPRFIDALAYYQQKLEDAPDLYDRVIITPFAPPEEMAIAPPASADMVLTFRNVHNWLRAGEKAAIDAFKGMFAALKPGGILGVVEHRLRPGAHPPNTKVAGGYMTEAYVIELVEAAGFKLDGRSEVNANPADTTNHPKGVWTLPPTFRLKEQDRERYAAIGESDRMTLRFIKQ